VTGAENDVYKAAHSVGLLNPALIHLFLAATHQPRRPKLHSLGRSSLPAQADTSFEYFQPNGVKLFLMISSFRRQVKRPHFTLSLTLTLSNHFFKIVQMLK
jgi:hypothetical protein